MKRLPSYILASLLIAMGVLFAGTAHATDCLALNGKKFGDATVFAVEDVKGPIRVGGLDRPQGLASLERPQGTSLNKPFCRVTAMIDGSDIQFELWLPPQDQWNGKFAGVGNGAFIGAIMFGEMERPFLRGYAVASTNTGHISTGSDSRWALGNPQRVADWAWRAHHLTAVASKMIVESFYGRKASHSYFLGCSKGGTSAMMEAQRFPEDYDGILAGAPGSDQSGQITSYLWTQQAVAAPGGWLSLAKLTALHNAVLANCDSIGGYVINPAKCGFDPAKIECKKGTDTDKCLTPQQVSTVRKIYSGPTDSAGKSLYPGLARGSELNWARTLMGPADKPVSGAWIFPNMIGYMGNVLYGRTDIDYRTLVPANVWSDSRNRLGATVDAMGDLDAFAARGGKLIHFQGWNDPIVRPAASPLFFEQIALRMGGVARVQAFYRLFMAPGMDHCSGGVGPNAASGPFNAPAPSNDPRYDLLAALETWVEKGKAPELVVATLYKDGDPTKGISAQRPWCPYPAVAEYRGKGDLNSADSYVCRPK